MFTTLGVFEDGPGSLSSLIGSRASNSTFSTIPIDVLGPVNVETNLRQTGNAEFACGNPREVNYSSADKRTTIGNPCDHRAPILLISDVDQRPER